MEIDSGNGFFTASQSMAAEKIVTTAVGIAKASGIQ